MEFLDIRHLQYSEQLKNSAQFSNALNHDSAATEGSQSGNMADKIREALGTYPEAAITNHGFQEAGKRVYILRASKQELRLSEYDGDWVVLNLTYKFDTEKLSKGTTELSSEHTEKFFAYMKKIAKDLADKKAEMFHIDKK